MVTDELRHALHEAVATIVRDSSMHNGDNLLTDEGWNMVFRLTFGNLPDGLNDPKWDTLLDCHQQTGLCGFQVVRVALNHIHHYV